MKSTGPTFDWEDYVVFSVMLVISTSIGLFFAFRSYRKRQISSDDLLVGGRSLPVFPVALSLSASFTSATTILGIPAEVYLRGGEQWLWVLGIIPCFIFVAFFILPVFHRLQLTNAYEYLELRFNKVIRTMGTITFLVIILTYMAAVLYAPAVALSQVTGLSREISVLTMGLVCTFYTSIGGIRAVVWTDAFQLAVVWSGLLALMFKGASDAGGWSAVWDAANTGDRLPRFDMNPDPFIRHTFWTLLIGGGTNMMTVYGANQANLQRYASVKSLKGAQAALLLCLPLWVFYLTILCLLGLVMYAFFLTCDPLTAQIVAKRDQLVPLFVLETMGAWPGLPGLFVAAIFSASISTVSSGVNSLAAVTLEDVVKPFFKVKGKTLTGRRSSTITVVLGLLFGAVTIGMAYAADLLGKTALAISFGVFGMVGGPLLGLIINGIFLPCINSWGAGAGLLSSLAVCLFAGIDPVIHPPPSSNLELRTDGCVAVLNASISSTSDFMTTTDSYSSFTIGTTREAPDSGGSSRLYLSYLHYSTLALIISVIIGLLVSAITGFNKNRIVDPRTVLDYSCCSSNSRDSYTFENGEELHGVHPHAANSNLAKRSHDASADKELYMNEKSIQAIYNNKVYQNL